MNKSWESRIY